MLNAHQIRAAVRYNKKKARTIGWLGQWAKVAHVIGVSDANITPEGFADLVAAWQVRRSLQKDGKIGPTSWRVMKASAKEMFTVPLPAPSWLPDGRKPKPSPIAAISTTNKHNPWMDIAREEMRKSWRFNGEPVDEHQSSADEGYFAATPYFGGDAQPIGSRRGVDSPAWCAAFVNYCLHTAGYSHTGSAGAKSFVARDWHFEAKSKPQAGCVVVLKHSDGYHVTFIDEPGDLPENPKGNVKVKKKMGAFFLGGNQSDPDGKLGADGKVAETVNSKMYLMELVAAKDSEGRSSPYLWPLSKGNNCNCDIPTAAPHSCPFEVQPAA